MSVLLLYCIFDYEGGWFALPQTVRTQNTEQTNHSTNFLFRAYQSPPAVCNFGVTVCTVRSKGPNPTVYGHHFRICVGVEALCCRLLLIESQNRAL